MDIPKALATDFVKANERVYYGGAEGSRITFRSPPSEPQR